MITFFIFFTSFYFFLLCFESFLIERWVFSPFMFLNIQGLFFSFKNFLILSDSVIHQIFSILKCLVNRIAENFIFKRNILFAVCCELLVFSILFNSILCWQWLYTKNHQNCLKSENKNCVYIRSNATITKNTIHIV